MSYHPRIYAPGLLYHLIAWRNNEQVMDLEPATYETFLKTLGEIDLKDADTEPETLSFSDDGHLLQNQKASA